MRIKVTIQRESTAKDIKNEKAALAKILVIFQDLSTSSFRNYEKQKNQEAFCLLPNFHRAYSVYLCPYSISH